MKVTIFEQSGLSEDYAEIHCVKETPEIKTIANYIESGLMQIQGKADGSIKKMLLNDIFYFESVDKKTYAYLKETVWEVEFTLKEIEEQFAGQGFVRINKSVIVNIYKVDIIRKDFEMRMLIQLENEEALVINRHYKKHFQDFLAGMKEILSGGAYENHK